MKRFMLVGLCGMAVTAVSVSLASAIQYSPWASAVRVESIPGTDPSFNGPTLDGCPFVSPNGLSFYMASDRPGGLGGLDIWVAKRKNRRDSWGPPQNLGAPVNSGSDDFCPSPTNKRMLYFVSTRARGCGDADIYATLMDSRGKWAEPGNLGCVVNSAAAEAGPFYLEKRAGAMLYFSSTRAGGFAADAGSPDSDIYVANLRMDGAFGMPVLAEGLNTAANDFRPNLRHDGLEIFFDSNRPGGSGGLDVWAATRSGLNGDWSTATNLGSLVNSAANESRPSLSWDATTLYFGSTRPGGEGSTDHYMTRREKFEDKTQ